MLEKKQVHSFLKILQIPTDQSPEEIELALKKAGWNKDDAREAVRILDPEAKKEKQEPVTKPQLVAQVSKPQSEQTAVPPSPPQPPSDHPPSESDDGRDEQIPVAPPTEGASIPLVKRAAVSPRTPVEKSEDAVLKPAVPTRPPHEPNVSIVPPPSDHKRPPTQPPTPGAAEAPVSFTPESVAEPAEQANVHERPVTSKEMASQLFRSDEHRLNSETITNLLGIDVEVRPDEFEVYRRRRQPTLTFTQLLIIVICSILLAFAALMYGMYLFQVGPFHPTAEAFGI